MIVSEIQSLEQQTDDRANNLGNIEDSVRQNQLMENKIDKQILRVVSSAVMIVEKHMQDAILTGIDSLVILRVEMAVKLITGSTGHATNSEVQHPDLNEFLGNIRNTPLMSSSSRLVLDNDLNVSDETHNEADFEDSDFPAIKHNYDRKEHANYNHKFKEDKRQAMEQSYGTLE